MSYVSIKEGIDITCDLKGSQYHYSIKKEDGTSYTLGLIPKEPIELSTKGNVGADIWNYLKDKPYSALNDLERNNIRREDFSRITDELQRYIDSVKALEQEKESEYEKILTEKYLKLASHFEVQAQENNFTELEFISQINQGHGVGLNMEVTKAFFGYLQTILGIKATNVIAIGNQASGKSHIVETALDMLPQENIHRGVKTVAHFFRTFNGQDLTGHIFYLGDLGGDNDDEDTIKLRDKLKQLTTDGYIERGIVDDGIPRDEYVTGYPCLTYTTANEDMINAQERSRSIIITPPEVDPEKLEIFNFTIDNYGLNKELIDRINTDKKSVQGLVYEMSMEINKVELFNPYMFNITDFLGEIEDFNRKIKEFNAILKIVCLLNNPLKFEHEYYTDKETYEKIKTPILIARKQDVLNALHVFDHTNDLLPTDIALANGLINHFKPFDFEESFEFTPENYEEKVKEEIPPKENGDVDWENLTDVKDNPQDYFFTIHFLRKAFNKQRWYRNVKDNLSTKLNKLYQLGILIKIGVSDGANVYGLNYDKTKKVDAIVPVLTGSQIDKALELFKLNYPSLYDEVKEKITKDRQKHLKNIVFEILDEKLYDVPWK